MNFATKRGKIAIRGGFFLSESGFTGLEDEQD
jgi:hypothetical protein